MSDLPPEEFRRHAHEVVDWIADYLQSVGDYPVLAQMEPGELEAQLPASAPEKGEPMESILADFRTQILPAVTHWNHPRFHAYFSVSASGPGILGEMLASALNVNGMVWKSSPAATELEIVTLRWLREWIGLPQSFFGVIFDTASISTMHAIAAAREFTDPESRLRGGRQDLIVYTSEQAHSSVEKGAIALGFGRDNVRKIAVDSSFRMRPDRLAAAMEEDRRAGKRPCCVVPTVGTTSTTSIDPVDKIAVVAESHGAWMHVDAAYGGAAAILPELRHILAGSSRAHSLVVNPHKWLFTPVDLSVLYTSRPDVLKRAFSLVPDYLQTPESGRAIDYMDYGVPLGRRFRSLKLWFVMRYFGRERVIEILRSHIAWASEFADVVRQDPHFELAAPVPLSLVCFRYLGSDEANRQLLERINASGTTFLSHTILNGRFVLRLAIGNVRTTRRDIEQVWRCIKTAAADL